MPKVMYQPRSHGGNTDREWQDPVILLGEAMQMYHEKKAGKYHPQKNIEKKLLNAIDEIYQVIDETRKDVMADAQKVCAGVELEISGIEEQMQVH